jgi:RecB family exonuclease
MLRAALAAHSPATLLRSLPRDHPLLPGLRLLAATESFDLDAGRFDARIGRPFLEERLSASALETLGNCPLRFFFQKVLRVRALEEEPGIDGLAVQVLGLAVHTVLERLYADLKDRGLLAPDRGSEVAERVDAFLPSLWTEVTAPISERRARRLPGLWGGLNERWLAALRTFVLEDLEDLRARGVSEISLETLAEADLDLGEGRVLRVRGRLDRIVEGPDGRRVGDYKTGGGDLHWKVEPKSMVTAGALQAPLYARMAGATQVELLGVGPAFARKEAADRRVVLGSLGRLETGFVETLGVLHTLLERGIYPLHDALPCTWCEYRRACRRTHPPTVAREKVRPDSRDFRDVKKKTGQQKTTLAQVRAGGRSDEVPA